MSGYNFKINLVFLNCLLKLNNYDRFKKRYLVRYNINKYIFKNNYKIY